VTLAVRIDARTADEMAAADVFDKGRDGFENGSGATTELTGA
jgi:hypothetical protein